MATFVQARTTFWMPGPRLVRAGEIFAAGDPVVVGRRELFVPIEDLVERATARPGERRSVRRPRKQAAAAAAAPPAVATADTEE